MVDDNFHYQGGERWEQGTYKTMQEALAACCEIVDKLLNDVYRRGMSAETLYDSYVTLVTSPMMCEDADDVARGLRSDEARPQKDYPVSELALSRIMALNAPMVWRHTGYDVAP
jgi:hypothetical protein